MNYRTALIISSCFFMSACSNNAHPLRGFGESVSNIFSTTEHKTFEVSESEMTQEEEYWLGKAVAAQIFTKYPPSSDKALSDYVNKIGQALAGYSDRPQLFRGYSFQLLKSESVNAMSAPGGFIFLTEGFLKLVKNEEDLAAIIAHEIAHIEARHGIASIENSHRSKGTSVAGDVLSALSCAQSMQLLTAAFNGAINDVLTTLLEKGYSREQEFEADALAKKILTTTGYSPLGLAEVLTKLDEQQLGQGGIFATHPAAIDRLTILDLPRGATARGIAPVRDARFDRTGR